MVAEPVTPGKELNVDFSSITLKPYTTLDLFLKAQGWSISATSPWHCLGCFWHRFEPFQVLHPLCHWRRWSKSGWERPRPGGQCLEVMGQVQDCVLALAGCRGALTPPFPQEHSGEGFPTFLRWAARDLLRTCSWQHSFSSREGGLTSILPPTPSGFSLQITVLLTFLAPQSSVLRLCPSADIGSGLPRARPGAGLGISREQVSGTPSPSWDSSLFWTTGHAGWSPTSGA